jgi:cytoskeletal protein RodZ
MSVETRVHKNQLAALEAGDLSKLPSRPFTIGYVKTYAKALGLDPEAQVMRFRQEFPDETQQLRAPIGVAHEDRESRPLLYVGLGVLVTAVVLWNIAQRTLISTASAHGPAVVAGESWPEPPSNTVISVGTPTPAPADQNTPKAWTTPGLDLTAPAGAAAKPVAAVAAVPSGAPFAAKGAVYGAANGPVLLQAGKSVSLVVRGPGGEVYFARELAVGEAYRASLGRGMTAEVSDPSSVLVYVNGQFKSQLSDPMTPIDKFAAAPAPLPAAKPAAPAPATSATPTA